MPFLRVTLNGEFGGQAIVNVLWYRTTSPIPTLADFLGYSEALAAEIETEIWSPVIGRSMKSLMPEDYTLATIVVDGVDEDGLAMTTTPHIRVVNEPGEAAGLCDTPAVCAILRFNLEPAFGPGVGLPTGGYLAIGPIVSANVNNDASLEEGARGAYDDLGANFSANRVTEAPPGLFYPVRVRLNPTGLPFPIGYRDVDTCVCKPYVSFRRSRMPRAGGA